MTSLSVLTIVKIPKKVLLHKDNKFLEWIWYIHVSTYVLWVCAAVVRGTRVTTGVSHTCSVQYYLSVYTFVVTVCFACVYYLRMILIPARCVVRGAIPVCH